MPGLDRKDKSCGSFPSHMNAETFADRQRVFLFIERPSKIKMPLLLVSCAASEIGVLMYPGYVYYVNCKKLCG